MGCKSNKQDGDPPPPPKKKKKKLGGGGGQIGIVLLNWEKKHTLTLGQGQIKSNISCKFISS